MSPVFMHPTKDKELSLSYYLPITRGRTAAFPMDMIAKLSTNIIIQDLNSGCRFHFLRR